MNPGDAGQPPQIGVHAPAGSAVSDIRWPAPRKHVDAQITTFIHEGDVTLPFSLTLPAGVPGVVPIAVKATWLICKDICIPEEGLFQLAMPVGTPAPSVQAALFDAAERARPTVAPWQAVVDPGATLSLSGDGVAKVVEAWFVPAVWGVVEHGAAQTLEVKEGVLKLAMQAGPAFDASGQLAGALLVHATGRASSRRTGSKRPGWRWNELYRSGGCRPICRQCLLSRRQSCRWRRTPAASVMRCCLRWRADCC
jgi:hypothetical protein